MRRIDLAYKTKVAWNRIPSNFAFLGHIDPMHRLGASVKIVKIEGFLLELKNSDNFRRRRRRNLSNLPPATTGYRRLSP